MIGRRKFLKALGITPLAAKAAAEKEMAGLAIRGWNDGPLSVGATLMQNGPMGGGDPAARFASMASYVRMFGIPAHVERQCRENAKRVTHLDPDLVSKRSWSFSVKIQEQQRRNYERQVEMYREMDWWDKAQKTFSEKMGWNWSW
jgi:hypothetical protein